MNFQKHYQEFYENFVDEDMRSSLKESIAQKTFKKQKRTHMKTFTRFAFAVLGVIVAAPLLAPQAFAESIQFVGSTINSATDKVHVLIARAFDDESDLVSDKTVSDLAEDSTVRSLEYTRDEDGESLDLVKDCSSEDDCMFSVDGGGMEFDIDKEGAIHIEMTSGEGSPEVTISSDDETKE